MSTNFTTDVGKLAASTSPVSDCNYILTTYANTTNLPSASVPILYNAIIAAANLVASQTAANLSTYLATGTASGTVFSGQSAATGTATGLLAMLATASTSPIFTVSTQKTGLTNANALISALDTATVTQITTTIPSTPTEISTLITNPAFVNAVITWRKFKAAYPLS